MGQVEDRLAWSNRMVKNVVWPHVSSLHGGTLTFTDGEWDRAAGVDALWSRGIRRDTLAARVQRVDHSWDSFTIRTMTQYGRPTEWAKRHEAVMVDGLRPHYTLQGYVTPDERLLAAALVLSDDLYRLAYDVPFIRPEKRNADGSRFRVIWWSEFRSHDIWIFRPGSLEQEGLFP